MDEKRYCGHCRQEIEAGATRCPHCGSELPHATPRPTPRLTPGQLEPTATELESVPNEMARIERAQIDRAQIEKVQSGTVGSFPTTHLSAEEPALSWSDGMVVADRFRLVRCIGQGGMGLVYLAQDLSLDRPIALKRVPQEIIFDGDARDDLRHEANRLLDLAHENVIRIHTYYDEPAWPFFAMEYLQGPTLKEFLRARKQDGRALTPAEVLSAARQVERGLTYAHSKNIIHRDLKPGNLMLALPIGGELTDKDVIKITDFGISRVIADSTMRQTGKRSGTLPYMSPEQFRGEPASVQSDVYSLAATYYELLSGKPPFYTGDIGYQIVNIPARPLSGAIPGHLMNALHRGLSKNPRHRPESVKELTDAMGGNAPSAIQIMLRRSRPALRGLGGWAAAIAALLLLGFIIKAAWDGFTPPGRTGADGDGVVARPSFPGGSGAGAGTGTVDPTKLIEMAREIQSQLTLAGLRESISRLPFNFVLRKPVVGELSTDVLKLVKFHLIAAGVEESAMIVIKGSEPRRPEDSFPDPQAMEFVIPLVPEGDYTLRTILHGQQQIPQASGARDRPLRIDMTGPSFELRPINRLALVDHPADTQRPGDPTQRFVTYNEEADLQVNHGGDVQRADFQIYVDSMGDFGDRQKIAEVSRWRVTLFPGENKYLVVAADKLGNESSVRIEIKRLLLEVAKFEVDRPPGGIGGNRVAVRGELNIEVPAAPSGPGAAAGAKDLPLKVPELQYFVNDQLVVAEEVTEPLLYNPIFRAQVLLPRQTNTIEVRYKWGDDVSRRFAIANSARIVQAVSAPRIELTSTLPARTQRTSMDLVGRVSPYYEGLKVQLFQEQVGSYALQLVPDGSGARFQELRQLAENRLNRFVFSATYRDKPLLPEGPVLEVYCDLNLPRLREPVEFTHQGEYVRVVVTPSEPLSSLQMTVPGGETRLVPPRGDDRYVDLVRMPSERVEFRFKMVDLAGNENVESQLCEAFTPIDREKEKGEAPSFVDAKPAVGTAKEGRERVAQAAARRTERIERAEFLKELGLEFVKYGIFAEEMATTEVSQAAWNTFLRERGLKEAAQVDPKLPMTIDDEFQPRLLEYFADWLTMKCADGYQYYIPTASQWMAAFAGSRDPRDAPDDIKRWFWGVDPAKSFNRRPRVRYATNDVNRIGERPENRTPTGLLDMEANIQEIVRDDNGFWNVIGGYNAHRLEELDKRCTAMRLFQPSTEDWPSRFTGFRLGRKPIN